MITDRDRKQDDGKSSSSDSGESSEDEPPGGGQTSPEIDKGPAGIKVEGNWKEVTETCTDLTQILKEVYPENSYKESERIDEWVQWYPKQEDDKGKLGKKTARQAKFEAEQPPEEHLEESTSGFASFSEGFRKGNLKEALTSLGAASNKGITAFFAFIGESLAELEEFIYRKIVVRTNPFYFDNSLISASFREKSGFVGGEEETYQMTIKVHDREMKDDIHQLVFGKN